MGRRGGSKAPSALIDEVPVSVAALAPSASLLLTVSVAVRVFTALGAYDTSMTQVPSAGIDWVVLQ